MQNNPGISHALFGILDDLGRLTRDGLVTRSVLIINHLLASEPAAMARLAGHAHRTLRLEVVAEPPLPDLRWMPVLLLRLTPAGLLEPVGDTESMIDDAGLQLTVNLGVALREGLSGGGAHRGVSLNGSADFAADVSWVMDNVRWDTAAELARWLPPAAAQPVAELLNNGAGAVAGVIRALAGWVSTVAGERRS